MTELDLIRAELRGLVDPDVGSGVTDPKAPEGALFPKEASAVDRAVPNKAGRAAAHQTTAEIGHHESSVLMVPDRSLI